MKYESVYSSVKRRDEKIKIPGCANGRRDEGKN